MTTAERFRRRQRIEGSLLVLLGIAVGLVAIYFHHQDLTARQCFADNFSRESAALAIRGELSERDASANRDESAATRQLIIDAFASKNRQEAFAAFAQAQRSWKAVDRERRQIVRERADAPLPEFPKGTCDA